jgi:glycosyltransferase involved in cell wall biosynthesis
MQNYTNYHIIIIDDASTDDTGSIILNFLRTQTVVGKDRYDIIRNSQQMRAMHNLLFAAKNYCKPNDIFLIVDGDDELLGRQVLKLFNAKFQSDGLYFMYTNFLSMAGRAGYSRPFPQRIINENGYRKYPFITSHLRAFYTQLFLNVNEEDLKDENGEYFKAANDVAICIPVLEQAHEKVAYVPELTYYYNSNTGLNNHALRLREQRSNDKKVRTRAKYM